MTVALIRQSLRNPLYFVYKLFYAGCVEKAVLVSLIKQFESGSGARGGFRSQIPKFSRNWTVEAG